MVAWNRRSASASVAFAVEPDVAISVTSSLKRVTGLLLWASAITPIAWMSWPSPSTRVVTLGRHRATLRTRGVGALRQDRPTVAVILGWPDLAIAGLRQTVPAGQRRGCSARRQPQLTQDAGDMAVHRVLAQRQVGRNPGVGETLRQRSEERRVGKEWRYGW